VLDNSNVPIPGVTVRAVLTNSLRANMSVLQSVPAVQTDAEGQFLMPGAPVGFVKLLVDGTTADAPGIYPSLEYDVVTVAGRSNTVGMPIYLLPLNPVNKLCVTPTSGGGTLTIPEAPGFSLSFGPGQVTFPGGSKTGCVSVTVVHGDKVPMVPGFGQQPRFIVTIQPAGALFNPPAPITLPNVDSLAPRAVTEMYSYDHDIGSFVAIGTGTVSDDGLIIRSDPGVGVLKAGWHCGGNPAANGTVADCPDCEWCQNNKCVADPAQVGAACDDEDKCTSPDRCIFGACIGLFTTDCDDHNRCTDDRCLSASGQCLNRDKPDDAVTQPPPSLAPSATLVGSIDGFFGANINVSYEFDVSCQSVCIHGTERFATAGDITPSEDWQVLVSTTIQLPGCGVGIRTPENIERTRIHELRHANFHMLVLNPAKHGIGIVYDSAAACAQALLVLGETLARDWEVTALRQRQHCDFAGETSYGLDCFNGTTVEVDDGVYPACP